MMNAAPSMMDLNVGVVDTQRHWSPTSQPYAPADVLMRYLASGWQISPVVGLEEHYHAGVRKVEIYHFELVKDGEHQILPVQSNPVVRRLLKENNLRVVMLKSDEHAVSQSQDD